MSWWLVAWLSLGAYAFKVLGFVVVGGRRLPEPVTRCLLLIPAALLAALVVKDAATTGQQLVFDERMLGLGVAAVAAWSAGARILRTHEVRGLRQGLAVAAAILAADRLEDA